VCVDVSVWVCVFVYTSLVTSKPADQSSQNWFEHFATVGHCEINFRPIEADETDKQGLPKAALCVLL
jgi:hypothetical protein